jgi:hypothetical protein
VASLRFKHAATTRVVGRFINLRGDKTLRNTSKLRVSCLLGLSTLCVASEGQAQAFNPNWALHGTPTTPLAAGGSALQEICLRSSITPSTWTYTGEAKLTEPADQHCHFPGQFVLSGNFDVMFFAYRDGALCANTSWWGPPGGGGNYVGVSVQNVCSNPAGSQIFSVVTYGRAYDNAISALVQYGPSTAAAASGRPDAIEASSMVRGRIPAAAFTPKGLNPRLVPELVAVLNREGDVAGYVHKTELIDKAPHAEPMPVYDEGGQVLVGRMYPDIGFVPLGQPITVELMDVRRLQ